MRYEASYNGRVIDIQASNEEEAMYKALKRFGSVRALTRVWPKRLTPVPPVSSRRS